MNIAIIGVVPWQQADEVEEHRADFMEMLYGRNVAVGFTFFIIWTALASVFVMTLGYSRILVCRGPQRRFLSHLRLPASARAAIRPWPLLSLGVLTAVFCFFSLASVIEAAVIVRIFVQFLGQIFGLHLLRTTRPDVALAVSHVALSAAQPDRRGRLAVRAGRAGSSTGRSCWPCSAPGVVVYPLWRRLVGGGRGESGPADGSESPLIRQPAGSIFASTLVHWCAWRAGPRPSAPTRSPERDHGHA